MSIVLQCFHQDNPEYTQFQKFQLLTDADLSTKSPKNVHTATTGEGLEKAMRSCERKRVRGSERESERERGRVRGREKAVGRER